VTDFPFLAQIAPSAGVLTDCYTVPAGRTAVVTMVSVCNRSSAASMFRISIAINGAADNVKQYINYDETVGGNDSFKANKGNFTLNAGDVIRVYAENATVSFAIGGLEIG
jgi:hypothetical protein